MNTITSLFEKIENTQKLDFGDIIDRTIQLFKKTWLQGFLLILVVCIIVLPLIFVVYMPLYKTVLEQVQDGTYNPSDPTSLMNSMKSGNFRYMILGFTFVLSFLTIIFAAGFYRMVKLIDFKEAHKIADLFYFFKVKYFGKILLITLFTFLVSLINFVFEMLLPQGLATFFSILVSLAISVYSTLFIVFFAFNPEIEVSDVLKLSFKLGTKKWLLIFGLFIVTYIMGCLGAIACGIGLLFTISIVYLPPYLIYKDVIGFDETSSIDEIGMHNETSNS